jgi:acyl-coenzyme A synthetase/AMP-(fatty) acid ligase
VTSPLLERSLGDVLFRGRDFEVTAAQLLAAAKILSKQLPPGAAVVNVCQDRFEFAVSLVAAISASQPVLLPPNRHPATVQALLDVTPGACLIHDDDAMPGLAAAHRIRAINRPAGACATESVPDIDDGQLCVTAFTSGSTGSPKANRKYWRTLRAGTRINGMRLFEGLAGDITVVATVPSQHMYGLETTVLAPLFLPLAVCTARPFYPVDIAAALDAVDAPRVLVTTPIHLKALLAANVVLPRVARVICATAPLPVEHAYEAEARFADEVLEVYGCTETGCLASRRCAMGEPWRLFPEFALTEAGGVSIASAPHLHEAVELNDVLETAADGCFRIIGRAADMLNVAGKRGSLSELTMRLLGIPGVRDGIVFVPSAGRKDVGRVAAMVVTDRPVQAVLEELSRVVDPVFMPRPMLSVQRLPRSEVGKLDHRAVNALWIAQRSS